MDFITSNHFKVSLKEHITRYIKNLRENAEVPLTEQETTALQESEPEDLPEYAFASGDSDSD